MALSDGRRYRVLKALGRGGFGTVFHAEMLSSGDFTKQVALKVLNSEVEGVEEIASRLRDEGRILGRLQHRAIVRVDGLVNFDGRWAVVMEYVHGADLRNLIEDDPLPVGPSLEILGEVAGALYAAYEMATSLEGEKLRLLHRDLKPANIQITPTGEVKVLDFGIARAQFDAREATTQSLRFGSLYYMSPERLDFIDGHEGDVYALGAVLYEVLVGQPLGKTSSNRERHQSVVDGAVEKLTEKGIEAPVLALITDCLAYEPNDRPTAREVHRRCRELRRGATGPWLSDWAHEVVPAVMAGRIFENDALCGAVLAEASGINVVNSNALRTDDFSESRRAPSHDTFVLEEGPLPPLTIPKRVPDSSDTVSRPAEPIAEPESKQRLWFGAGGLLVVMALMAWVLWPAPTAPVTTVNEVPEVVPVVVPVEEPVVEEVPEDEGTSEEPVVEEVVAPPEGEATEEAVVTPPTIVADDPPPEEEEPEEEPEEVVPPTGTVLVTGGANALWLVGEGGARLPPGVVPTGRYQVLAVFPGSGEVANGSVTVGDGATVTIHCDSSFLRCSVRR